MNRFPFRRAWPVLVVALAAAALAACNESLDAGAACPSLCPGLAVPIRDTVLTSVVDLDTTLVGYPSIGTEEGMPLAARGDTLDVRGVIRFDSLTTYFAPVGDTGRSVTRADTAILRLRINKACAMLSDSEMYIASICHAVGFNNVANFNRHFFRIKGMTPSDFRKRSVDRFGDDFQPSM